MYNKEKDHRDQLKSLLLLSPSVVLLWENRDVIQRFSGKAIDILRHPMSKELGLGTLVEEYLDLFRKTPGSGSGQPTKELLTKKASEALRPKSSKRAISAAELVKRELRAAQALSEEQLQRTSDNSIQRLEEVFRQRVYHELQSDVINTKQLPMRNRLLQYMKFLAYKHRYGLELQDLHINDINPDLLERYAALFDAAAAKGDDTQLREQYIRLLNRAIKDSRYFSDLILDVYQRPQLVEFADTLFGRKDTKGRGDYRVPPNILHKNKNLLKITQSYLEADAPGYQTEAIFRKYSNLLGLHAPDRTKQSKEIVKLFNSIKRKVEDLRANLLKVAHKLPAETRDLISSLNVGMRMVDKEFGGYYHKEIVIEIDNIFNTQYHGKPLEIRIPVEYGPYMSRGVQNLPVITPRFVPFGTNEIVDPTLRATRAYQAVVDKIARDIQGTGLPRRAQRLVDSIIKGIFEQSSPLSATPRDLIKYESALVEDLLLGTGQGSYRQYRNILSGFNSVQQLLNARSNNEYGLVFDLEFVAHQDLLDAEAGPQKIIKDPRTSVYNISAKIVEMSSMKEVDSIDILIDPKDPERIANIRDFLLRHGSGVSPDDIETFLTKELQGKPGYIDGNKKRIRRLSLADALKDLVRFAAPYDAFRYKIGHNISGADIPLLQTLFHQMQFGSESERRAYHQLKPHMDRFLKLDPLRGNDGVIDTYPIAQLFNLGQSGKGNSLTAVFSGLLGGLDETAFGEVLKQANFSKGADEVPVKALEEIAKRFDTKYEHVERAWRFAKSLNMSMLSGAAQTAHMAGVDTSINQLVAFLLRENSTNLPFHFEKYAALAHTAYQRITQGQVPAMTAFSAMDFYRPGIFTDLDSEEHPFTLSLFSSSQQQAARLIGSMLHIEQLIPFGSLNNLMRQHYQAFTATPYAPPTKRQLEMYEKKGMYYLPGQPLSTEKGKALYEVSRRLLQGKDPQPLHNSVQLPIFFAPENYGLVRESQAVMHEVAAEMTRYFRSPGHIERIDIDLPAKWANKTEAQIKAEIYRYVGTPIKEALGRKESYLNRHQVAEIMDYYFQLPEGQRASDPYLQRYMLFAGQDQELFSGRGPFASQAQVYRGKLDGVISDIAIDKENGKINLMIQTVLQGGTGVKYTGGATKSLKSVVFQNFGDSNPSLRVSGAGMIVGSKFGSRSEIGSFYSTQIGRILLRLNNDPKLSSDPAKLVNEAKQALKPLLGKAGTSGIKALPVPGVSGRYYLEVVLPSSYNLHMQEKLNGSNLLASLQKAGITWDTVRENVIRQGKQLKLSRTNSLALFHKTIDDYRKKISAKISDLEKAIALETDKAELARLENELKFQRKLLINLGKDGAPALYDVMLIEQGDDVVPVMGTLATESVQRMQDILDYSDATLTDRIETRTGLPMGHTRFKPYFTAIFEENILNTHRALGGDKDVRHMLSYLDSRLGSAYVSDKTGNLPVGEGLAWMGNALKLLKHSRDLEGKVETVRDLFTAASWLKDLGDDAGPLAQAIKDAKKYRILHVEDFSDILKATDPDRFSQAWRKVAVPGGIDNLPTDHELVRRMRGIGSSKVVPELLRGVPIFDPSDKTALNLLKLPSAATLLEMAGVSAADIEKNPVLKEITQTHFKLNILEDVVQSVLNRNEYISPALKALYASKAEQLGDMMLGDVIPIPSLTGILALPEIKESGVTARIWTQTSESVRNLMAALTDYSEYIKAAGKEIDIKEFYIRKQAVETAVSDVMHHVFAKGLGELTTRANKMFDNANYRVLGSTLQLQPVLDSILSGKLKVSDDALYHVLNLATVGTELAGEVAAIGQSDGEARLKAMKDLARKVRQAHPDKLTYAGTGLLETVRPVSESIKIAADLKKRYKDDKALHAMLDDWLAGKRALPGFLTREPSFAHQTIAAMDVWTLPDEILNRMGYSKEALKSIAFVDPVLAKQLFADHDLDIAIELQMGDSKALKGAAKMVQVQRQELSQSDVLRKVGDTTAGPIDVLHTHAMENRIVFSRRSGAAVTPDATDTPALSSVEMPNYRELARQHLVVKSFTPLFGMSALQHIMFTSGEEAPINMLPELVKANQKFLNVSDSQIAKVAEDINFLRSSVTGKDPNDTFVRRIRSWFGQVTEGLSIKIKAKDYNTDPVDFLKNFTGIMSDLNQGNLTENQLKMLFNDRILKESNLSLGDLFKDAPDPWEAARSAFSTYNRTVKLYNELNKATSGRRAGDWLATFSSVGMPDQQRLVESLLDIGTPLVSNLRRQRSLMEKALGFGQNIDPINIPYSELELRGPSVSLASVKRSGKSFLSELIGESAINEAVNIFKEATSNSKLQLGALALSALWFFSPNQGVTPVGTGGEFYEWSDNRDVDYAQSFRSAIRPPSFDLMDKLLDVQPASPMRVPVGVPVPPRMKNPAYVSDLRMRNATLNDYIQRAQAVMMT